jgi:hypothetical protein
MTMRWTLIALTFGLSLTSGVYVAAAATTKDFLYRCSIDEVRCAARIKEVARAIQNPPPGQRAPAQLCFPRGLSDEGLAGEVTHWIDEQVPSLDNKDEFDSIAAALTALYSCGGIQGLEGD